jgi:hypothetical protein
MPAPVVPIILSTLAVVGVGVGVNAYVQNQDEKKRKARAKKKSSTPSRAEPVFAENATLGNSPTIVAKLQTPIEFGELGPIALRRRDTSTRYNQLMIGDDAVFGDGKALSLTPTEAFKALVTNMSPQATQKAWDALSKDIRIDGGVTFDMPSLDMENTIVKVLQTIKPDSDWSNKLGPYGATSVEAKLWAGVMVLGELLYQSIWNAYVAEQDQGGGIPADGAIPPSPATPSTPVVDAGWKNYYAKGDLQGPAKIVGSGNYGSPGDDFFAQIKIFEDNMTRSSGTYTGVASYEANGQGGLIVLYDTTIDGLQAKLLNTLNDKRGQVVLG